MLHQSLPLYEGNQPFIYVCYCAEDDDIAFPVIARMYNEGFRIWCASAGGIANDFRTIQRMNASASIMLFLSRNMLELLRMSDPEVVAVAKNPRLHIVVSVDGSTADKSMWALAVPDAMDYTPGNDAAFWLYMYTSEKLEKCRGPWPEKKIRYRESNFDFFPENVLQEEYSKLENIIRSDGTEQGGAETAAVSVSGEVHVPEAAEDSQPAYDPESSRYRNNNGYIAPEKDDLVYVPLGRIEAVKSESEKEFDAFIGYLDRWVEKEEKSVAEQIAEHKYIEAAAESEKTEQAETVVPVPEITPRFTDPAERNKRVSKVDKVVTPDEHLTAEELNPEARRRRLYENGKLDKVLDPNDIDAVIQKRKKEERERAEENERKENEKRAAEAAELFGQTEQQRAEEAERQAAESEQAEAQPVPEAQPETAAADTVSAPEAETAAEAEAHAEGEPAAKEPEAEEKPGPEPEKIPEKRTEKKEEYVTYNTEITEESLENMIVSSDSPKPAGFLNSEQLASAPTYVMVPPSDGTRINAPSYLKLVEAEGGMIAVPVPPENIDGESVPGEIADRVISDDYGGMPGQQDNAAAISDKKRHTVARKVKRGVKVTPIKCEVLHKLPRDRNGEEQPEKHRSPGRAAGDIEEMQPAPAETAPQQAAQSGDDAQQTSMRKFRNRPVPAEETAARANEDYSDGSLTDEMLEELEPKQSHRKNRHPHSSNGLLANIMAMLRRGRSGGAEESGLSETEGLLTEDGLYEDAEDDDGQMPNGSAAAASDRTGGGEDGEEVFLLSAAVEKFIEVAPPEPVMVVPRRK